MTPIATRPLGQSGVRVTELGFGAGPIGGLYRAVSDDAAVATVAAAHASGVRYFDVAPLYGLGESERRLGLALAGLPRDDIIVSTKVGRLLRPTERADFDAHGFVGVPPRKIVYDYSRDGALRSIEASLARLRLDRIDIAFIHDVDHNTHGERQPEMFAAALDGAYPALLDLRARRTVRAIGVAVNDADVAAAFMRRADIDCALIAGRYTLLDRSAAAELIPLARQTGVGLVLGGPYNSGILATGAAPNARFDYAKAPPAVVSRVRRLQATCDRCAVPLAAAALQFALREPAVATVIPGAASAAEARRNAELLRTPIPDALWRDLAQAPRVAG